MRFEIFRAPASGILSRTTGFIAEAGFTHSLTPARNCTFGCTYCYVPTMGIYGGLKPDDWRHWGRFTTFKSNAADLLLRELRAGQTIYCSPLVDPYQPAEFEERAMPAILDAVAARPPRMFVVQTRGPLILRDLERLKRIPRLRVSFSITTDREEVRRWYEPHCAPNEERLNAIRELRAGGIEVYATLAPLLPCDPRRLVRLAIAASGRDLIGDPFHARSVKARGATTREAGRRVSQARGFDEWHDPEFMKGVTLEMRDEAERAGFRFATGPEAFGWLAHTPAEAA